MNWLYKLQRKCRHIAVENLMLYITVTMLAVYLADSFLGIGLQQWLYFSRNLIMRGQVWRLLTFVFIPTGGSNALFVLLSLYFYYFIGNSLEQTWGSSQFTFYYLCGVAGAIIAGFLTGGASNSYLNLSLFFAFAQLYPEHQVLLFFIIPVKMKFLGYLNWALFGISFIGALLGGDFITCAAILFSLLNFFLFFGPDLWNRFQNWKRFRKSRQNFRSQSRNGNDNFWR